MERYINTQMALKIIDSYGRTVTEDAKVVVAAIRDIVEVITPAADVVPKSEVERLTVELDAMRGAANTYKMHYENARKEIERLKDYNTGVAFNHYFDGRKEVAREIFEDIEKHECHGIAGQAVMYMIFAEEYAELKKKYTEEQK